MKNGNKSGENQATKNATNPRKISLLIELFELGETYRKGNLYIDGRLVLLTLEDTDRGLSAIDEVNKIIASKIYGRTAIPIGRYKVVYRWSEVFQSNKYFIEGVKGFEGVMFHEGNSSLDSKGCILVGCYDRKNEDFVGYSKTAMRILNDYLCSGKNVVIELEIVNKITV